MGAWGPGSFENDTALDFVDALEDRDQLVAFFKDHEHDDDFRSSANGAEQLLAAADLVACMFGRPATDATSAIRTKSAGFGHAGFDLLEHARNAVSGVMGGSELLELWAESDASEFNLAVTSLMARLNPDLDYTPPDPKDVGDAAGAAAKCAFCDNTIEGEEVITIKLTTEDMPGMSVTDIRTCHLSCLNKGLHPNHLFQRWKISDEMVEHDLKKRFGD